MVEIIDDFDAASEQELRTKLGKSGNNTLVTIVFYTAAEYFPAAWTISRK